MRDIHIAAINRTMSEHIGSITLENLLQVVCYGFY